MMDLVGKASAPQQQTKPAQIGSDGALDICVVPAETLNNPGYSSLTVHHGITRVLAPVVASCPHAGRDYPATLTEAATLPVSQMRGLEDFGVDHLITGLAAHGITTVINKIARAYIDVNRPIGAVDTTMFDTPIEADKPSRHVNAGYGLIPRLSAMRQPLYTCPLPAIEVEHRLGFAHMPYHSMLTAQIAAAKAEHGHCLLVDFHSMPPSDRTNRQLADIILGDCLGTTLNPELGQAITSFFIDEGLSVAWNEPYAGGFITREHGRAGTPNQSIQIEINRSLYMRDARLSAREPHAVPEQIKHIAAVINRFGAFLVTLQPR
jgi:N-formylglutamate amidohydrolase